MVSKEAASAKDFEEISVKKAKIKLEANAIPSCKNSPCGVIETSWQVASVPRQGLRDQGKDKNERDDYTESPLALVQNISSMLNTCSSSVFTEASTASQHSGVEQCRTSSRRQNLARQSSLEAMEREHERIINERAKEWKEKQTLYRSMRLAAAQPIVITGGLPAERRESPATFPRDKKSHDSLTQRLAFGWYPSVVTTSGCNGIGSYPSRVSSNPKIQDYYSGRSGDSGSALKRRYESDDSSFDVSTKRNDNEEAARCRKVREPVIKEVVSLSSRTSSTDSEKDAEQRRAKRLRRSIEEPSSPLDLQESPESGTSETERESPQNLVGKYISDFAPTLQHTPDDHQIAHINGLLSLPSNRETRYGITYGELKRRCNSPEYLTRVDLVAYVRHSKTSGRNLLDKYKIVAANRASRPTILSKMCENEARVLGDGILQMNMEHFPDKVLAETATKRLKTNLKRVEEKEDKEKQMKKRIMEKMLDIETARSMLKEVFDLLHTERDCEEMQTFECASHTFGTVNLMNHLTLFDRFFQRYQSCLSSSINPRNSSS